MKRTLFILMLLLWSGPLGAADQVYDLDLRDGATVTPEDHLWRDRLIVVFADAPQDPRFIKQIALLSARPEELRSRQVVVVVDTAPDEPSAIRLKLRPRGFSLVFVDKDGLVKLRKARPWHVREIVRSIDKTALRREELREIRETGG